jgi:hypothetical protein
MLEEMNAEIVVRGLRALYVPDDNTLDLAFEMGRSVGERLAELCGGDE